jgi:hypothetical protein
MMTETLAITNLVNVWVEVGGEFQITCIGCEAKRDE